MSPSAGSPAPPPAGSPLVRLVAYGAVGLVAALLLGLFARALPDAVSRAKHGHRRAAEASCEALQPSPVNARLGALPASAPDFTLKDFEGRELSLSQLRGQVVLVNFWATWCQTCVVEMPSLERLTERMRGRPFRLLAVSVDEGWPEVRKFFAQGTPLEILLDAQRSVPARYGTEKFPETFLIDKEGHVRYYVVSDRDWSRPEVVSCLESLIAD